MQDASPERRLAAIVAADVVGYSHLMGADEAGTHARLKTLRQELIETEIAAYHGRIVKLMGDGILVEFPSVVDAVACAVEFQRGVTISNQAMPEDQQIVFRVGINLGDIIVEDNDIYGDGVNIASRLEGLADPGGICISQIVHDSVGNKLPLDYEDMGAQTLKNIAEPVRAYRINVPPDAVMPKGGNTHHNTITDNKTRPHPQRRWAITITLILLLGIALVGGWQFWESRIEPASVERMAYPLPDKPSIAVLPFDNLSVDSEQDYFADGITEDIIATISRIPELFVIARNSTFTYKGKPVKVQQVAEELGVRYVLEGSVRRDGEQVRITAQLIDAIKGHHIWVERYDRDITGIFALQDEITLRIADALHFKLAGTAGEGAQIRERTTDNLKAWDLYIRGAAIRRAFTRESFMKAKELWQQAVEIDPGYATAWAGLAALNLGEMRTGWSENPKRSYQLAVEYIKKALSLDQNLPRGLYLRAFIKLYARHHEEAMAEAKRAVASDPNNADAYYALADIMRYSGYFEEALSTIQQAMRLNPNTPPDWYLYTAGVIYRHLGQYDKSIETFTALLNRNPSASWAHASIAANYVALGRLQEAKEAVKKELAINPKASLSRIRQRTPYKDPIHITEFTDAVAKVGFPE